MGETKSKNNKKPAKYSVIKKHICHKIESGQWPQHYKVPSENELTQQFDVSRMTARRALQELTEQGILVRAQGSGTFVATFKSQSSLLEIRNISDEINERGHKHHAQQLKLEPVAVTKEVTILLNLKNNEQVFFSQVLHFENNQPIQLEQRYVNASLVPEYLLQDFTHITPHEYLSDVAPLTEATHEVEAILATDDVCQLLDIDNHIPCLQVKRRTWSSKGVVSLAILTTPGNKYRLGSHLKF
ncbi:histidine utilization repressor [Colwellia sp. 4_MG-2023]|jgi:GntR family histidine utilization transcriptional repressor|uniref:histidine utilization repressor n=1 Tax=unclassified Colwellia TaxID=196834 RepID=UPI001C08B871|nr:MULTISPECIES: histidine utilization repressor [unclassified Colwellia]MBU2926157.1 histidine utilization repressor [Colwellia sp. C2M11]MDO6487344.1 histidine utilization repressor [Colwellia sp. 6_MG-2023]MDO6507123.1 histidine utilization repressor [Colwellia sp. 5_MG-2023]MDO6555959.1 histidine utilization repressor [Colwellia sp. 4_MG-2023]MDO6652422.1 histidine utilization repressor [Colwellia sp. 3_MG-2023]